MAGFEGVSDVAQTRSPGRGPIRRSSTAENAKRVLRPPRRLSNREPLRETAQASMERGAEAFLAS